MRNGCITRKNVINMRYLVGWGVQFVWCYVWEFSERGSQRNGGGEMLRFMNREGRYEGDQEREKVIINGEMRLITMV